MTVLSHAISSLVVFAAGGGSRSSLPDCKIHVFQVPARGSIRSCANALVAANPNTKKTVGIHFRAIKQTLPAIDVAVRSSTRKRERYAFTVNGNGGLGALRLCKACAIL
jgi:hypothetical protein